MKVYVINGSGGSGKDTFVEMVRRHLDCAVYNISSVEHIKQAARILGWNGEKTKEARLFLHKIKMASTEYNDSSLNFMLEQVRLIQESNSNTVTFLHVREPEEIGKLKEKLACSTILVYNDRCNELMGNEADDNVYHYNYDLMIDNSGSIDELSEQARAFCKMEGLVD